MYKKMTLKIDEFVIKRAKKYAASHKQSLSRIIESYLQSIPELYDFEKDELDIQISPFVKSMSSEVYMPADLDYKADYANHLAET